MDQQLAVSQPGQDRGDGFRCVRVGHPGPPWRSSSALEREGFKVQTYIDGESALVGLTRNPPDLAVLDIKMPRMDGEELLKKLRKKMSIPIIFLTSKDEEVDELLGLKLGADDFVKKSGGFSTKVLIERIRVQLRKKNSLVDENKT